jgi:steroid 5-alpha reductase family enzyme
MNLNQFSLVLFLIFLTLKLANVGIVSTWSWWLVFSPILISFMISFISGFIENIKERRERKKSIGFKEALNKIYETRTKL